MSRSSTILYVEFGGVRPGVVGRRKTGTQEKEAAATQAQIELEDGSSAPGQIMSSTYSRKEVSQLFEVGEGRLRYWDSSGFISPSGRDGRKRCYTFQDLVGVRSAKTLLESGLSLQRVRKIIKSLQEKIPLSSHPLGRLRIMSDSQSVTVLEDDCEFDADSGQLLLDFNVSNLEEQVVSELPRPGVRTKNRTAYEWYLEGCRLDEDEVTMPQAEEAYHRAVHLDPTFANAYTNLGNLLYRRGAVQDAKALYQKAIEVDSRLPEAHYNLGFIEFEKGNLETAALNFSRAVELDSTFADAHFNMAITLFRLGQMPRAQHHLQHYLTMEPTGPWADIARKRLQEISQG